MISRKDVGHYIDLLNNNNSLLDEHISWQLVELLWELLELREYKEVSEATRFNDRNV